LEKQRLKGISFTIFLEVIKISLSVLITSLPVSYAQMVFLVTPTMTENCSCVRLSAFLSSLIFLRDKVLRSFVVQRG